MDVKVILVILLIVVINAICLKNKRFASIIAIILIGIVIFLIIASILSLPMGGGLVTLSIIPIFLPIPYYFPIPLYKFKKNKIFFFSSLLPFLFFIIIPTISDSFKHFKLTEENPAFFPSYNLKNLESTSIIPTYNKYDYQYFLNYNCGTDSSLEIIQQIIHIPNYDLYEYEAEEFENNKDKKNKLLINGTAVDARENNFSVWNMTSYSIDFIYNGSMFNLLADEACFEPRTNLTEEERRIQNMAELENVAEGLVVQDQSLYSKAIISDALKKIFFPISAL